MPNLAVRYEGHPRKDVVRVQVERHLHAGFVNAIANDPHVRPWVAPGNQPLDMNSQVENRNNVLLAGEHGCCMFVKLLPGVYEVHTVVDGDYKGEWTSALTSA